MRWRLLRNAPNASLAARTVAQVVRQVALAARKVGKFGGKQETGAQGQHIKGGGCAGSESHQQVPVACISLEDGASKQTGSTSGTFGTRRPGPSSGRHDQRGGLMNSCRALPGCASATARLYQRRLRAAVGLLQSRGPSRRQRASEQGRELHFAHASQRATATETATS